MLDVMFCLALTPASYLFVIRVTMLIEIACYSYGSLFFCKLDIGSDI
jgi:hypothetical protein